MPNKEFTINDTVALMHEDTALAFRRLADFIEKYEMDWQETVEFMREIADNKEAQAIVVKLRDDINKPFKNA